MGSHLVTVVVLAAMLAGCAQTSHIPTPQVEPATKIAAFQDALMPGFNLTGEPSVAVAPDGTIYVAAPTNNGPAGGPENLAWRGDPQLNGLYVWSSLGGVNVDHGSNDADIAVRADASVWEATYWSKPSANCIAVSHSTSRGANWTEAPQACGSLVPGFSPYGTDRPWLATATNTTYLLYGLQPAAGDTAWALSQSQDGLAWSANLIPVPPGMFPGRLVSDGARLAIPVALTIPGDPVALDALQGIGPFAMVSSDHGLTWTTSRIANEPVEGRLYVAVSPTRAVSAWTTDSPAGGPALRIATAQANMVFDAPLTADGTGTNAYAVAAARQNHLLVAWLHANATAAGPGTVAKTAEWRVRIWLDGNVFEYPRVVARGPLCPVNNLSCAASFCQPQTQACVGGGDRILGDFFSADITENGTPIIAINDGTADHALPFLAPTQVLVGTPPQLR